MSNDELGMIWWNKLTHAERRYWLNEAGSARPIDAWKAFQAGAPAKREKPSQS